MKPCKHCGKPHRAPNLNCDGTPRYPEDSAPRTHSVLRPSNAQAWTQCPASYTQPQPVDNTLATVATVLAVEAIVEASQSYDSGVCTPDTPIDFGSGT